MEGSEQRKVVEALVLASPEPISAARIAQIVPDCTPSLAKQLVGELNEQYEEQERSFEIWEVAGGYQLRTRAEFSGYLQQLQKHRPLRLSRPALETLSIVAYKQPVTRGEVEQVRGVDVGAVMKSLMERHLLRITGQREVPGRPMLYGTTRRFLEVFGLESLGGLPTLRELEEIARERGIENPDEVLGLDAVEGPQDGDGPALATDPDAQPDASPLAESEEPESSEVFPAEAASEGALAEAVFEGDAESPPQSTLSRFGHGEEPYSPFADEDTHAGRFAAGSEDTHADRFAAADEDADGSFGGGGSAGEAEDPPDEAAILERE
ncbi:MAG: SMC-Scp complex subunit ScpB [Deltaproteobacteria bacterium]|nr:SMC-Scp complex subunit ScpB [Deltaproteobacteria bacterium]MBW2418240.1 SMC-Scp complex subunit ScpB [Deltaproteobacteria bacterium]